MELEDIKSLIWVGYILFCGGMIVWATSGRDNHR